MRYIIDQPIRKKPGYYDCLNEVKDPKPIKRYVCQTDTWSKRVEKSPLITHVEEKTPEPEYEAELSSITGQLDRYKYLDKYKEALDDDWQVISMNMFSPKGWER